MQPLHANVQWLEVPERIKYKLCMMMRRCQGGTAPQYLVILGLGRFKTKTETETALLGGNRTETETSVLTGVQVGFEAALG